MTLLRNALPGSDRENVRQAQGLATHLNPLQQITNRLPLCNCSRRSRYLLVMSPEPKGEFAATAPKVALERFRGQRCAILGRRQPVCAWLEETSRRAD